MTAINRISLLDVLCKMKAKIISGANFCHVARIKQDSHDSDVITDGNQKWNGAIPNLTKIAATNSLFIKFIDDVDHCAILAINMILEPNACAIKYLIAASVS
jgi:hypothetical protein